MNIVLVGYGKMGKAIEKVARDRQHKIINRITPRNRSELSLLNPQEVDIAIEFSQPQSAPNLIKACLNQNIAVVSGTTSWNEDENLLENIKKMCVKNGVAFLHAPNFSLGVQLFFRLNRYLAKLMSNQKTYQAKLCEIHHTEKLDAPSGTAVVLAEQILDLNSNLDSWALATASKIHPKNVLPVAALRQERVPGTHRITYQSDLDQITLEHKAFDRIGFAQGALMVAEWLHHKQGFFTIEAYLQEILGAV